METQVAWNAEFDCPQDTINTMYSYLDDLRESGITNMFGAGPYLAKEFDIDKRTARLVVGSWMNTFSTRHPNR